MCLQLNIWYCNDCKNEVTVAVQIYTYVDVLYLQDVILYLSLSIMLIRYSLLFKCATYVTHQIFVLSFV